MTTTPVTTIEPGTLVVSRFYAPDTSAAPTPVEYAGPSTTPGMYSVAFGGVHVRLYADLADIAPMDAPYASAKDERIVVANDKAGRPGPWVGPWRVQTPGMRGPSWHRTKRAAVAYGTAALTVEDWHAANA